MADRIEGLLSPITRAVLEALSEGVVVLDAGGQVAYSNAAARQMLLELRGSWNRGGTVVASELAQLGARTSPVSLNGAKVCDVVVLPARHNGEPHTLAERERDAIVETLHATGGKLTESARRLGISRTTLWRRLRSYGIDRGRWSRSS